MKAIKKIQYFLLGTLFFIIAPGKALAQNYSITVRPTNVMVGEKVYVAWTSPFFDFDIFDFVGWFTIEASDQDYIERRSTFLRFGDTDFEMNVVGEFNFRLFNGAAKVATSPVVRVQPLVPDPLAIRNYPSPNRNIIAFGDGLIKGVGAAPEDSLVAELSRLVKAPIRNAGVAGDTSERALKRLATDALAYDPQVVLVLLGGEDALQRVARTNTAANLRTIIARLQESGAVVILIGVGGGAFTNTEADGFRVIASETGSAYVPNILRGISDSLFLFSGAIYPDAADYRIMAQRIFPALEKLYAPKSELRLSLARNVSGFELRWPTLTNRAYQVLAKTALGATNWQKLASLRGSGGITNYFHTLVSPAFFFKIEETR